MKIHPAADIFPMMTEEELQDLAADIKENGLIHPIITDADGEFLIDGRNREKACKIAGIKPTYEKLNGQEPLAYIVSANLARRNLTKGQQAMALAMIYPEGERGKKDVKNLNNFSRARLSQARAVLRYSSKLAEAVVKGTMSLDEALATVKTEENRLTSAESQLAKLRTTAPDLADQVDEERLKLTEALAAYDQRKRDKEAAEQVATQQLQEIMVLLNPGRQKSEKVAKDLFDNINPKYWARTPDLELSKKSVAACAEMFSIFAELWAKRSDGG